jgi:hypothetical protein
MWRLSRPLLEMCTYGCPSPRVELPWSAATATASAATTTDMAAAMEVVDEVSVAAPTRAFAPGRGSSGAISRGGRGTIAPDVGQDALAHGPERHRGSVAGISKPLSLFEDEGGASLQERGDQDLKGKK